MPMHAALRRTGALRKISLWSCAPSAIAEPCATRRPRFATGGMGGQMGSKAPVSVPPHPATRRRWTRAYASP